MRHENANSGQHTAGLLLHNAGFYDLTLWLLNLGRRRRFHERLLEFVTLNAGDRVLDVGCGTGSLAVAAKHVVGPSGAVFGVDASPKMLARARKKACRAGVEVTFTEAHAQHLPYPESRFDVVLSTLMLHHLPRVARTACAAEIARVLRPGGRALAVDFEPRSGSSRGLLGGFHRYGGLSLDALILLFRNAGLHVEDSGEAGFAGMQFLLAARPEARAAAAPNHYGESRL